MDMTIDAQPINTRHVIAIDSRAPKPRSARGPAGGPPSMLETQVQESINQAHIQGNEWQFGFETKHLTRSQVIVIGNMLQVRDNGVL